MRGTCLEYLENLTERLELLGLEDRAIRELRQRVRRHMELQPGGYEQPGTGSARCPAASPCAGGLAIDA
jgi:hypothetical protein